MVAKPPQLLFFTAVLFFCTAFGFSAKHCPDCANISVPYPLSTGPTCGDPSYKIRCNGDSLIFDTMNNSYRITSINPQSQRLVIRPANLLPDTCVASDFIHQGIHLNNSLPFNITSSNTIIYLNCTDSLLLSPLNCSSNSLCHTYINGSKAASPCEESLCCSFRTGGSTTAYMIQVRNTGCSAYSSFVNLNPNLTVNQWPEPGLEIQWELPREPVCGSQVDCGDGGNFTCGPDPHEAGTRRCFCNPGFLWDPVGGTCFQNVECQSPGGCGGSAHRLSLIAGLTSVIVAILVAAIVVFLLYKRNKSIKESQERMVKEREEILHASVGCRTAKLFTGKEIKRATKDFSKDRLIGAGGYGEVYQGILEDGTFLAVKVAKVGNTKGTDQVLNEVRILCQVNHRNLVRLLGCSVELEQPILVYEYIDNGNLLEHLQGERRKGHGLLNWTSRLRISHDTAEGLAYLHSSAVPPIYHRDVKSSNILLDGKLNAKVSDFGLSRLAETDLSHISTCAQGTLGYLDPEYYRNYQLTDKSDVYSFGVVLLELLTSQKAIDFNREADDVSLTVYVQRMVNEKKLMELIDSELKEGASTFELETMKSLVYLALSCLEDRRQNRPSMKEVVEEIEYIMSVAIGEDPKS